MHLVESQALCSGLKIGKPFIWDHFTPLPFDGSFISFQPFSKYESKNYDYWKDVIDIIFPTLLKNKIHIVQIGLQSEDRLPGCIDLRGKTSFNQAAYIVRQSVLHLGTDSFAVHIASGLQKKIVALYNIMHPSECGPYWSKESDVFLLEPPREKGENPSYSALEEPKTINKITPEKIANKIMEALGLELDYPYKTLYTGEHYGNKKVELIPHSWIENVDALNVDALILRMDLEFNEQTLSEQLKRSPCGIVTDRAIDLGLLETYKPRLKEFVFLITEERGIDSEFLDKVKELGIKINLMTFLKHKNLNKFKLKALDYGPIYERMPLEKEKIKELEGKDLDNLCFKSSSYTVKEDAVYACKDFSFSSTPVDGLGYCPPMPVIDSPEFWSESDYFSILEKT